MGRLSAFGERHEDHLFPANEPAYHKVGDPEPWRPTMSQLAHEGVTVVAPGNTYIGKQGFTYGAGASRETVGAAHVCMNVLPLPAGAIAKAHYHEGIETIAYMLEGECVVHFGPDLEKSVLVRTGEHCFVAADVPHAPQNASDQACTWLVVHSSGSDQDGIVLLPELDAQLARKIRKTT